MTLMIDADRFEVDQVGGSFAAQKRSRAGRAQQAVLQQIEKHVLQEAPKYKPVPLYKNHLYLCSGCGYSFWAHWEHELPKGTTHCMKSEWLTDSDAIDWIFRKNGVPDWGTPEEIGFELEPVGGVLDLRPLLAVMKYASAVELMALAVIGVTIGFFGAWTMLEQVLPFLIFFYAFRVGRILVAHTPDTSNDGPMKRSTS